jgi:hypothetical protein
MTRVWILRGDAPAAVEVRAGVGNAAEVAVEGELKPGDLVITGEAGPEAGDKAGGRAGASGQRSPMSRF